MPFIPHTEKDVAALLASISIDNIETLFDEIPAELRSQLSDVIPPAKREMELLRLMQERAELSPSFLSFLGAGAYEHHIPAAVWDIASRGEILTAYTPYQAEASQGALQALYEYQTMMVNLLGMEVANASLYEGASALAEAALMAVRCAPKKARKILIPQNLHPYYLQTVYTILHQQNIELIEVPFQIETGLQRSAIFAEHPDAAAIVIQQPNFFGLLEQVDELVNQAHELNMLAIACVNPTAMGLIKEPGSWGHKGADIACGEGQPLGVPLASGGPYFGFLATRKEFVRQMPGRIVGRTQDLDGKVGYTLTLQAREQHIRRSRATSNICTNQGLLVSAATIYLSLLGEEGLAAVAQQCHLQTVTCLQKLEKIPGVSRLFDAPFFHEIVVRLPKSVDWVLQKMAEKKFHAGIDLQQFYPALENSLMICVTETKTQQDIDEFVQALQEVLA